MDKLFERFHRKQIYARAAIVRSVLVGCAAGIVLIFLALTPAFATFYEVNGKIIFDKKPLRDVDVYLLKEAHDVIKRKSIDGKQTEEITHQEFKEVNERLAKKTKRDSFDQQ